jgi:thiol-disulfide isomerase/thioredoxin
MSPSDATLSTMTWRLNLDSIVNIVNLLTCVLLIGYISGFRLSTRENARTPYAPGSIIADTAAFKPSESGSTLILVTASTCHYCTESMPFYQRVAAASERARVRLVAATEESLSSNAAYLQGYNVRPRLLVSSRDANLKVRGTPTVILTKGNVVQNSWLGKLSPNGERDVLDAINALSAE